MIPVCRVLDHKWAGDFVSHDNHVILEPLQFSGQVTRSLSGWCTAIPAVSVVSKLEAVQVRVGLCVYLKDTIVCGYLI